MAEDFFSPCPRGLEAALAAELERLGADAIAPVDGGAGFEGALELAYRVNLESRLASRVLWKVGGGPYRWVVRGVLLASIALVLVLYFVFNVNIFLAAIVGFTILLIELGIVWALLVSGKIEVKY